MKIYIGLDIWGNPMGLFLSDSREKVEIAWAAMGDTPHSIEVIDPNEELGINGLAFILTSKEHRVPGTERRYREWKRGV